jgi:hypothetical protein
MSVNMLWPIPARDTTQLKNRKRQFKISSWGKFVIMKFSKNGKNSNETSAKYDDSLFRMPHDNLTGLRTITKKALHMLSGQQQVSMQEAVHMVDNQELVICSDRITYVSLAQGQALQSETDKLQKNNLITVYRNRNEKHNHLLLEQYFYCVFID